MKIFLSLLIAFVGVDYLAVQHKDFPCKRALKVFNGVDRPALGFLMGTFGTKRTCIAKFMKRHPKGMIRAHLNNGVSRRKENMEKGDLCRRLSIKRYNRALSKKSNSCTRSVRKRIRNWKKFFELNFLEHELFLSLGLEDQLSDRAVRNLIKIVREEWPYEVVRNPLDARKNHHRYGRQYVDYVELHGKHVRFAKPRKGIYSNDGRDVDFRDGRRSNLNRISTSDLRGYLREYRKGGSTVFAWWGSAQGLDRNSRSAPKPRDRKPVVSRNQIVLINRIIRRIK